MTLSVPSRYRQAERDNSSITADVDVPTLELVLVNDGSTDGTLGLMNILAMEHPEQIVVVDRQTNGGMGRALADGRKSKTCRRRLYLASRGRG